MSSRNCCCWHETRPTLQFSSRSSWTHLGVLCGLHPDHPRLRPRAESFSTSKGNGKSMLPLADRHVPCQPWKNFSPAGQILIWIGLWTSRHQCPLLCPQCRTSRFRILFIYFLVWFCYLGHTWLFSKVTPSSVLGVIPEWICWVKGGAYIELGISCLKYIPQLFAPSISLEIWDPYIELCISYQKTRKVRNKLFVP